MSMVPAPSLCGITRGQGIGDPCHPERFFTSPGLTPDTRRAIRTSPSPGCGSGISPMTSDSRGVPRCSYHAALIDGTIARGRGCPRLYEQFGFDAVDIGGLAESWRLDRGQAAFVARQNVAELRASGAGATRGAQSKV